MAIQNEDPLTRPDPTNLRSSVGMARVEKDDFVINDVALTIPPLQIHIEKQSQSFEWQTLRTRSSTTAKSGRGTIYISLDIVFKQEDFDNLIRLVAGLRACPFCVVSNQYLEEQLKNVQQSIEAHKAYKQFQPIVLALTSMSFSTMGHEGYVDCISGRLEFFYFNYFPYTPVFAFKTGENDDAPGPVWQSRLWQAFYRPYYLEASLPKFPHSDFNEKPTIFRFREYKNVDVDKEANSSTSDLVSRVRNQPSCQAQDYFTETTNLKSYLTEIAKPAAELSKRMTETSKEEEWTHLPEHDIGAVVKTKENGKTKETPIGAQKLYMKERSLVLSRDNEFSTQQITISFNNILSVIPIAGYSYPTCQHIGNTDAIVVFTINASNIATAKLQRTYDLTENIDLHFKRIPQGFRNITVENDFLGMFGIKEFIFKSISSTTIPEMPGRSSIVIEMKQTGITSKTTFDDCEVFNQEYVVSSDPMRRKVYDVMKKYFAEGVWGPLLMPSTPDPLLNKRLAINGIAKDEYNKAFYKYLERSRDIYNDFLERVHKRIFTDTGIRGEDKIGKALWALQTPDANIGWRTFWAVNLLKEENNGFIPEIERLKKSVIDRSKTLDKQGPDVTMMSKMPKWSSNQTYIETINKNMAFDKEEMEKELKAIDFNQYQVEMQRLLDEIIRERLDLEQFKHLKGEKDKEGLGRGRLAYPDFYTQLTSIVSYSKGTNKVSASSLIDYDPDAYLWYPVYNGSASSPTMESLFDSRLFKIAKQNSIDAYNNAQGNVDDYFKETYLNNLQKSIMKAGRDKKNPYEELIKNLKNNSLPVPVYGSVDKITNSSRNSGEGVIKQDIVPDISKLHSNWYQEKEMTISATMDLEHKFDVSKMWEGVSAATVQQPPPQNTIHTSSKDYLVSTEPKSLLSDTVPVKKNSNVKSVGNDAVDFRLKELQPQFSKTIEEILLELKRQGYPAKIVEAYRSDEQQAAKIAKGYAPQPRPGQKISAGKHGMGLAADIVWNNKRKGAYNNNTENEKFFRLLGDLAKERGLKWGGDFKTKNGKPAFWRNDIGWDPGHVESRTTGDVARRYTPSSISQDKINKLKDQSVLKDITSTVSSPIVEAIKEFETDILSGQGQSLLRAYPTFKLYFIEDDKNERKRLAFDDFFSYDAVKSIRVVRSREIAADLCVLELTNISGVLSNRKFKQDEYKPGSGFGDEAVRSLSGARNASGQLTDESQPPMHANTKNENPIASLMLQEGIQISLKLGFSSAPDLLDLVFTGHITNVEFSESDDLVVVVAQSFATELVQDIKGLEKPESKTTPWWNFWGIGDDASTGRIFENMLGQPEVLHFGRWRPKEAGTPFREMLTDKWQFTSNPADDNIFAPDPELERGKLGTTNEALGDGLLFHNMKYVIYQTTIWDIFKEMELRHPNFVGSPIPYKDKFGDRMTYFFGMPNQLYFARYPRPEEEQAAEKLKDEQVKIEEKQQIQPAEEKYLAGLKGSSGKTNDATERYLAGLKGSAVGINKASEKYVSSLQATSKIGTKYTSNSRRMNYLKRQGIIRPFRRYHLLSSDHHIISNNIQTDSRNVANTIAVQWADQKEFDGNKISLKDEQTFILKVDNALPTEDIRTQYAQFVNVTNEVLAKRYALGLLCRNMKRCYAGDIVIIGNPRIKPYDICYLYDENSDMVGPIEARQVTHFFSQETGFITEIVPDMVVAASDWSLMSTYEALGIIAQGAANSIFNLGEVKQTKGENYFTGFINSLWMPNFMINKIINFTQLGHPLVMAPLTHRGRVFAGGIPTRKIPTSLWKTIFGKWYSDTDNAYGDWLEEAKDSWVNMLKKATFQYSTGDMLKAFTHRSFEVE